MNKTIYSNIVNGDRESAIGSLSRISQNRWQHTILEDKIEFRENCNRPIEIFRHTTERFYTTIGNLVINIDRIITFERKEAFTRVVKEKRYLVKISPLSGYNPVFIEGEDIRELFCEMDERRVYAKYVQELKKRNTSDLESYSETG